ncbi:MAG: hypothetical protein WC365_09235 [Candidatus Babeliales bacterium]|jgi:hypothetical protein
MSKSGVICPYDTSPNKDKVPIHCYRHTYEMALMGKSPCDCCEEKRKFDAQQRKTKLGN